MYGRDDIYNSPAAKPVALTSDHVGDSVAESFGADYEWFGGKDHKQKKAKIARLAQKLTDLLEKEKYSKLHDHAEKLAKVVEKLQDKEKDYEPESDVKAWVAYGNSAGEKGDLKTLLGKLGIKSMPSDAGGYVDGGGSVSDVTRPGDAAYYQAPPEGAYEYATGPSGPGYAEGYPGGYGPGYGPGGGGDVTNIYNYGPQESGRPGPGGKPSRPQIAKPGWMSGKPSASKPSKPALPFRPSQRPSGTPKPSKRPPMAKTTTPFRPSAPKPQAPKPRAPKSLPKLSAKTILKKSTKFGAMGDITRAELFGGEEISRSDLFGGYLDERSLGVSHVPGGKALAAEMSYGDLGSEDLDVELSYGALGGGGLNAELEFGDDVGAEELDVDMDYGALTGGGLEQELAYGGDEISRSDLFGALTGGGLEDELSYGALESESLDAEMLYGALESDNLDAEMLYGGFDSDPHASTDAFRPTQGRQAMERSWIFDPELGSEIDDAMSEEFGAADPRRKDHRSRDRRTKDRRGASPGSTAGVRGGAAHMTDAKKIRLAEARRAKGLPTPWLDAYEKSHFGAEDQDADGAEIDLMLCDIEEVFGGEEEPREIESGGKLDLSYDSDEEVEDLDVSDIKPASVSGRMQRREGRIGKSSPLIKRDLENQIERLGKQYETARKAGDTAKMKALAQLHAKATASYRESQKQPELATRQQALMTEKVGAWQY